jgi:hypothetical protein
MMTESNFLLQELSEESAATIQGGGLLDGLLGGLFGTPAKPEPVPVKPPSAIPNIDVIGFNSTGGLLSFFGGSIQL